MNVIATYLAVVGGAAAGAQVARGAVRGAARLARGDTKGALAEAAGGLAAPVASAARQLAGLAEDVRRSADCGRASILAPDLLPGSPPAAR